MNTNKQKKYNTYDLNFEFTKSSLIAFVMFLAVAFFTTNLQADEKPYKKSDGSYISITGDVASTVSAKGVGFTLDYGDGIIAVEADDFDMDDDSAGILPGERVTVYGRIDDDLFEIRSIEAGTIYVHDRNSYYFASSADEELSTLTYSYFPEHPKDGSWVSVDGVVKNVDSKGKEFEIKAGSKEFKIETHALGYNPLDNIGLQQIQKGDRVSVTGILDTDFLNEDDIVANSVITVNKNKANKNKG